MSIPKPGNAEWRKLKIGVMCDRVVARALYARLNQLWESTFLPCSYGFREAISPWKMLAELDAQMMEQKRWVLAIDDLKSAFDNVPIDDVLMCHRRMLGSITIPEDDAARAKAEKDRERLLWLIEAVVRGVDRALEEGHFRGLKGGHRKLPGEAGRAWGRRTS